MFLVLPQREWQGELSSQRLPSADAAGWMYSPTNPWMYSPTNPRECNTRELLVQSPGWVRREHFLCWSWVTWERNWWKNRSRRGREQNWSCFEESRALWLCVVGGLLDLGLQQWQRCSSVWLSARNHATRVLLNHFDSFHSNFSAMD